ncbi:class I SAM-dependent methyltransferase [Corynebacterium choanae]|uniref:Class I SAM-dependent methyltransferase n=1 Tax=Corynebacterium choanae TaxID=1862358 RepID=A0A3G6JCW1_9CORY|nr:class I SAM-dependent methyltransferase [Corynebacterium choanae]AZA14500.1 hypothetical protein CCHOA_10605 [Corynebacterium choanae]
MAYHGHNQRASFATRGPIGAITRGTTNSNRLRRCDRWMRYNLEIQQLLLHADAPLAIDVGYGASHTTTCQWARWLRQIRPDIAVLGLEIHPDRVLPPRDGVEFALGGFELAGHRPHLVRAWNVLRQYDVAQVEQAWATVTRNMADGGRFIEGTCDELGRRATWITLTQDGPETLTLAWDPQTLARPSDIAERLPKALIHCNTEGFAIHAVLKQLDQAWLAAAATAPFGPRFRWQATLQLLAEQGLPFRHPRRAIRDNLITLDWSLVNGRISG